MNKKLNTYNFDSPVNYSLNIMDLPGSDFFKIEIVNSAGANIEKKYKELNNKEVYGISHLCEHLAFKSTLDYTSASLLQLLLSKGNYNASTDHDRINYWFETISDNFELAIKLVSNIAFNDFSKIDKDEFESEKNVVANEIRRYHDDNQTIFSFNSSSILFDLHQNDNVLGNDEVVLGLNLDTVKHFRSIQLNNNPKYFINIAYDSTKLNDEYIIVKLYDELSRHNFCTSTESYETTKSLVEKGQYLVESKATQSLQTLIAQISDPTPSTGLAFSYISSLAENMSLNHYIREKNGLTYGLSFANYTEQGQEYMYFSCDVEKGNENLLFDLFKQSINEVYDTFTEEKYNELKDVSILKDKMSRLALRRYLNLFEIIRSRPTYFDTYIKELAKDNIDDALDNFIKNTSYEQVKYAIEEIKITIQDKQYSIATNYNDNVY